MRPIFTIILLLTFGITSFGQISYSSALKPDFLQIKEFAHDALIGTASLESVSLSFTDEDEANGISYLRSYMNKSSLGFFNAGGWLNMRLRGDSSNGGLLELFAGGGTGSTFWVGPDSSNPTRGRLYVRDNGNNRIDLRIFNNIGLVHVLGANGDINAALTSPSGRPNDGYVTAHDPNGQIQAALIVNEDGTGTVFADTKNFRIPHPEQPGKEIWYCSVEGPEAAAYERGTAELTSGEAFIPYSDHFQLVINPETVTVILTPHSADTYGLAVVKKTQEGFYVRELRNGSGQFGFDWEVKGVRKGHENYRVIRDASEVLAAGQTPRTFTSEEEDQTLLQEDEAEETPEAASSITATLGQNRPNPAGGKTVIPYSITGTYKTAEIRIFDMSGKLIEQYRLQPDSGGQLEVANTDFSPGMYVYSLMVDGALIASRQMVFGR